MSKAYLKKNIILLEFLTKKCKNKQLLENIINNSEPKFIFLLKNIFNNFLANPISNKHLNLLYKHKNIVKRFLRTQNCNSLKKLLTKGSIKESVNKSTNKIVQQKQKGGFIGTLLSIIGAALPVIISLFHKHK